MAEPQMCSTEGYGDAGTKMRGIGRYCQHGPGRSFEQPIVDHRPVGLGNIANVGGQGETTWK
jgi:hypothetical protein